MRGVVRKALLLSCIGLGLLGACGVEEPAPAHVDEEWDGRMRFHRVLVVVLENTDYQDAMAIPYLRSLASRGTLFSDYHAISRPSYPNYLAMTAGGTFGVDDSEQRTFKTHTVARLLENRGYTWRAYAQGYPGDCNLTSHQGAYWRKHVPFLSFTAVTDDPARCAAVVDERQFVVDYESEQLPSFAFYVPDIRNDGHDTGVAFAGQWLERFLEPLLADRRFMQETLVVVTFDEADSSDNQVYTVFLGDMVRTGLVVDEPTNHYNVLRTIEENFQTGTLGRRDAVNGPLTRVWNDEHRLPVDPGS